MAASAFPYQAAPDSSSRHRSGPVDFGHPECKTLGPGLRRGGDGVMLTEEEANPRQSSFMRSTAEWLVEGGSKALSVLAHMRRWRQTAVLALLACTTSSISL